MEIDQSEAMEKALNDAGVPVKFVVIPGGGHGATFGNPKNPPDYRSEVVAWLDEYLKV